MRERRSTSAQRQEGEWDAPGGKCRARQGWTRRATTCGSARRPRQEHLCETPEGLSAPLCEESESESERGTERRLTDLDLRPRRDRTELGLEAVDEARDERRAASDDDVGEQSRLQVWVDLDEGRLDEAREGLKG